MLKGKAYGIPSLRVDGNDLAAVDEASRNAVATVRTGKGPFFLELLTYRLGAHSSSDDPTRYRDPAEVDRWLQRDPLVVGRKTLAGHWTDAEEKELRRDATERIAAAIAEAEALPPPPAETLFQDIYGDAPWIVAEQREALLAELAAAPRVHLGQA